MKNYDKMKILRCHKLFGPTSLHFLLCVPTLPVKASFLFSSWPNKLHNILSILILRRMFLHQLGSEVCEIVKTLESKSIPNFLQETT